MDDKFLIHYGVGHLQGGHSGRYPWGSGENPYQRSENFMDSYKKLRQQGMDDEAIAQLWGIPVAQAFTESYNILKKDYNKSRTEIARMWNISTTELDAKKQIYTAQIESMNISRARKLQEHGYSKTKIAELMNTNESTVRNWLSKEESRKQKILDETTNVLRNAVEEKHYIQVGSGVEARLGITPTKMKAALALLKEEGYEVINVQVEQLGTGNKTTIKVLCPPGTTYSELKSKHMGEIQLPDNYISKDGGKTFYSVQPPESLDPSRIKILYSDEQNSKGEYGIEKDGVIELRRGVADLSLGKSNYAQVRIKVGDDLYLKGMAIYSDDLPDGVDVVFNTNKPSGTPFEKVLKPIKEENLNGNPGEIFGATIKAAGGQTYYEDPNGKFKGSDIGQDPNKLYSLSVVNKVNEEGDWDTWSRTLASQMLSKQNPALIKQQLNIAYADKVQEFEEIKSLTNPVVKKDLLEQFADDCDASSVDLKAAAMPRQSSRVLLPVSSMKDDEIFAPDFQNGEKVVLIRYPHQGVFEIPELTVNNNQKDANKIIGKDAKDAVGISLKTARQMSGADFDGDTVLVIPNNNGKIRTEKYYKELQNFDADKYYDPSIHIDDRTKNLEMGKISNLITDMTLQGAPEQDVVRAVKHAMVIIDAKKHQYNYKQSEIDNGIDELRSKYQKKSVGKDGGASTLISKASSEERVSKRQSGAYLKKDGTVDNRSAEEISKLSDKEKENYILNSVGNPKVFYVHPDTGEKLYRITPEYYTKYKIKVTDENGKEKTDWVTKAKYYKEYSDQPILDEKRIERLEKSTKMAETKDARTLSSGNPKENLYADYANKMKAMANDARKESLSTPTTTPLSKEAKVKYANEIDSLEKALLVAKKNVPLEKQAQIIANVKAKARIEECNCADDADKVKKIRTQELNNAREQVGASGKASKIYISDKEWEAMNSGAISYNKQAEIIRFANKDRVRELATPRKGAKLTDGEIALIKQMYRGDYTTAEIARRLGRSESSVRKYIDAARGVE